MNATPTSPLNKAITNQHGSISILFAVFLGVAIIVMGVSVDLARAYLVRNKLQASIDASLLGAVSSAGTVDVQTEFDNLFKANYPTNYMGSQVVTTNVQFSFPTTYRVDVNVNMPNAVMKMFGYNQIDMNLSSEVDKGLRASYTPKPEIALVLDSSSSMKQVPGCSITGTYVASNCLNNPAKIFSLQSSVKKALNVLYGNRSTIPGAVVSIVPYSSLVKIDPARPEWVKSSQYAEAAMNPTRWYPGQYFNLVSSRYFTAARPSNPATGYFNPIQEQGAPRAPFTYDLIDTPPTNANNTKFVLETLYAFYPRIAPLKFALENKQDMIDEIDSLVGYGPTRIDVGLFWGWMTLSPNWRGVWDSRAIPSNYNDPNRPKILILMTDGKNELYPADDDKVTKQLCTNIKAKGISIYTVAFDMYDGSVNTMLRDCATNPSYYYSAGNADQLDQAFTQIADDILYKSMRITQ